MGFKISVNNIGSISNYRHAFGTVTIPIKKNGSIINKQYLIDCTYNQFLRVNDNVAFRYIKETAGIGFFINQDIKNIEFSKKLLKDGFIEIDENNIEYYIKPFCLRNVELKKLDKFNKSFSKIDLLKHLENVQEQFDYEEEEFINWDFNLNINDNEKKL